MTQKLNLDQISRKELRNYVLTHRQDEDALRIYMKRLHSESGINRYTGGINEQDFSQLEQLLEKKCDTL